MKCRRTTADHGVRVDVGRVFVIVFVRMFDELLIEFAPRLELPVDIFEFRLDIEFMFDVPLMVLDEPPIEFEFIEFVLKLPL